MPETPAVIDRARQLFRFLKEFAEQRLPKQRLLSQQIWTLSLTDLPAHPSIAVGTVVMSANGDSEAAEESTAEPLLKVTRPRLTPSPRPPVAIIEFLNPGWEEPDNSIDIVPSVNRIRQGETVTELFTDDPARVRALETWKESRGAWATAELPARAAMKVYERLYQLRGSIELQSEQVELILADGRLRWNHPEGPIDHPVLLQRVELVFDTDLNEFRVIDADRPPELYGTILGGEAGIPPEQFHTLRTDLEKGGFHPLAKDGTSGFLKRLAANLGPQSEFVDHRPPVPTGKHAVVGRDPFLILRTRPPGFAAAFERILDDLENRTTLPPGLTRVLGIEEAPGPALAPDDTPPWGEPPDVLLSKPANAEQVQIARVLEHKRAILVQGPPGTGKSHTIANLIGHLVAKGKRVLVTSHTTKALRVLRDQVVKPLQPLCVSVLDNDSEGRAQLEESVRGIIARLTVSTDDSLGREVGDLAERRLALNTKIGQIVRELHTVRLAEYEQIVFGGNSEDPASAAAWVSGHAGGNDWIPGPVESGAPVPLDRNELAALYSSSSAITRDEEKEIAGGALDISSVLTPDDFEAALREAAVIEPDDFVGFWDGAPAEQDVPRFEELDTHVRRTVHDLDRFSNWQRAVVAEGHSGGAGAKLWVDLSTMIVEAKARWERSRSILIEHAVDSVPAGSPVELRRLADEILAHVQGGGSLGTFSLLLKGQWRAFIRASRVNGAEPTSKAALQALCIYFEVAEGRYHLATRWRRLAEPAGLPVFEALPGNVESAALEYSSQFDGLLNWWSERWNIIESGALELGFRWPQFRAMSIGAGTPASPFDRDADLLRTQVQGVIGARVAAARGQRARRLIAETHVVAENFRGTVCSAIRQAAASPDANAYRAAIASLRDLVAKVPIALERRRALEKLAGAAPAWASAINTRSGVHGSSALPGDPIAAWRWQQLSQEIRRRSALDEMALTEQLKHCQASLRDTTADLIDRKAWLGQLRRVGLKEQQALNGWAQLQKKIGKGTGKRAPKLQAEARRLLVKAQGAVPVWIMPLARVADAVDPANGRFDVVIIDEASQCDINGLLTWYLADQVVVVGDDKQVSPMAVGQKADWVQGLINQFLHDIPNNQLYAGTTSLYDLAQTAFGGTLRLREHFRCMPDIIGFSNELSYDFEIKPLRNPHAVPAPHVVEHVVAGAARDGKTNRVEAQTIAALIGAMLERPESDGKTFGAISLLGDEQAHLIWEQTALVVEPKELERRRFIAGNSAQFQGDERDVIFLSMVDAPKDGPLPMRADEYLKQRYNVAASRARDQMWLVHSLDSGRDLKPSDIRRQLINYVHTPGERNRAAEKAIKRAESPFEIAVIKKLSAAGYAVDSQVWVGGYRIDMVVRGKGAQVAVECDGARFHPPEKIPEDLARQAILERCGWRFIRIRSTAFFSDADKTMAHVFEQLRELGVEPDSIGEPSAIAEADPVIEEIRRRAWEIMRQRGWVGSELNADVPAPPVDLFGTHEPQQMNL
jgi:very-short-patch-repair endonuclease